MRPKPLKIKPQIRYSSHRVPKLITTLTKNALTVDPRDIEAYVPTPVAIRVAEHWLAGRITAEEMANSDEKLKRKDFDRALTDSLLVAWASRTVHQHISHRLGLVDAAMFARAVRGDVRAATFIRDRYIQQKAVSQHLHLNLAKLSDEDLDRLIEAEKKKADVIDVESEDV